MIHFAEGLPGKGGVISGMRKSCDIVIFVDAARAIGAGIKFWKSANGIILSDGLNGSGIIPPEFFSVEKVHIRRHEITPATEAQGGIEPLTVRK